MFQWAKDVGFSSLIPDLHVTVLYSRSPVDWTAANRLTNVVHSLPTGPRKVVALGDQGAIALEFSELELSARHDALMALGGSHDYPTYRSHVTLTYMASPELREKVEAGMIAPYQGELMFGPEVFEEIKQNYQPSLVAAE